MKVKIKPMKFRRRREGKTNYSKRLKLLMSKKPRIVIRRSLKHINAQIAKYDPKGDKILVSATSASLKKVGWTHSKSNLAAAYLTGVMLGKAAQKAGVKEAIIDMGLTTSVRGNSIYATIKGLLDSGLKIPADEKSFPKEERISGKHVADYAKKLKENQEAYKKQFSSYVKTGADPEKITEDFQKVKNILLGDKQ